MIVISGVPRSGTSVCTNIVLELLGEDRLIGSKFMGRDKERKERKAMTERTLTPIQQYNKDKMEKVKPKRKERKQADFEKMRDMNPKGFYECPFTVQGLYWRPQVHELMKKVDNFDSEPFCKIVSNGLMKSDPTKISKIVYMLRDPHEVAKSQEKLTRRFELPEGEKIHSPDFFIRASVQFCKWITKYAEDVELLTVLHSDLLSDPETQAARIAEFLGVSVGESASVVEKKLHRSKPEDIPHPQWEDADKIFQLMCAGDYQGVIDYMSNPEIETHQQNTKIHCHRLGKTMIKPQCELCKSNPVVMRNYKKTAEKRGIDWKSEPCAFECGVLPAMPFVTVEESIVYNHWNEV